MFLSTLVLAAMLCATTTFLSAQEWRVEVYVETLETTWTADKSEVMIAIHGSIKVVVADSLCQRSVTVSLPIDDEQVRIKLQDAEGRKCMPESITMMPIDRQADSTILAKARILFSADDGGAPRAPITGSITLRMHEVPLTCTDELRVVHLIRWSVDYGVDRTVKDLNETTYAIQEAP